MTWVHQDSLETKEVQALQGPEEIREQQVHQVRLDLNPSIRKIFMVPLQDRLVKGAPDPSLAKQDSPQAGIEHEEAA